MTSVHLHDTPFHPGSPNVLEIVRVRKGYSETPVILEATLCSPGSETIALQGPSGSGKSTLLNVIGLLTRPDSGTVTIRGTPARELNEAARARVRQQEVGFVFQDSHLLPALTTLENVMLASTAPPSDTERRAQELLDVVGLPQRANSPVRHLSGGEAKRAAVARALINTPSLILADEPTAGLDLDSSLAVLDLLTDQCSRGAAVLIASHDPVVSTRSTRVVELTDGHLTSEAVGRGDSDE
ncbi:ABC transporter ATP-binding protein [Nocardiopsis exhalans]|uniref:ABC transporter ATP-binding protein n=1 Tax=Nocardiopsis exhalans TaxID=163604 RepID=A0ABY5DF09_9ACTN|nr:ABC transporter ATP-binding protein [Nocardiopsis exhalans]USY21686.1 ABC transporter ATP-binding protein [Nocardiopsis exhalans]